MSADVKADDSAQLEFSVMTYNLYELARWQERETPMRLLLEANRSDVLCVQELRPATRQFLDNLFPEHKRVDDPFEGWANEGNIWWADSLFELVNYGAEDVGIIEPLRRLFWVRLRARHNGKTVLISTAHYTWQGHPQMKAAPASRLQMAARTVEALNRLAEEGEPVLFMGDLNDRGPAVDVFRTAGMTDSFSSIGLPTQPTHPTEPPEKCTLTLDWQLHRGPIRVIDTKAITFCHNGIAPSDHKPVVTTYVL